MPEVTFRLFHGGDVFGDSQARKGVHGFPEAFAKLLIGSQGCNALYQLINDIVGRCHDRLTRF
jgi:hypothetical protein